MFSGTVDVSLRELIPPMLEAGTDLAIEVKQESLRLRTAFPEHGLQLVVPSCCSS